MSPNTPALDLEGLEGRIQQAADLIVKLKTERDALRLVNRDLEARLERAEPAAQQAAEYRRKAQDLESRLNQLTQERTTLARRIEQMLDKLRAAEEDKVGAAS